MAKHIGEGPVHPFGLTTGMTYRQWLVGQALAGLCALPDCQPISRLAVEIANDVLEVLAKEEK